MDPRHGGNHVTDYHCDECASSDPRNHEDWCHAPHIESIQKERDSIHNDRALIIADNMNLKKRISEMEQHQREFGNFIIPHLAVNKELEQEFLKLRALRAETERDLEQAKAEVERLKAAIKKALAVDRSEMVHAAYMGDVMELADDGDWCWYDDVAEALGGAGDD